MSDELPALDALGRALSDEADAARSGWSGFEAVPPGRPTQPRGTAGPGAPAIELPTGVLRAVGELVRDLRDASSIGEWHFVRKAPALRVRFRLADGVDKVGLRTVVDRWVERTGWQLEAVVYEPEQARFGGRAGMALAHRCFTVDSDAAVEVLGASATEVGLTVLLSACMTNDLLGRLVDDRAELYDVWHRLGTAVASVAGGWQRPDAADVALARASMSPDLATAVPHRYHPLIARLQRANAELASAARDGRGDLAVRGWAAHVTIFHWNRFGLTTGELGPMVAGMCATLQP